MSLILDALNRSERERQHAGDVPSLATEHYADTDRGGHRAVWILAALAGVLLVLAAAWWFLADTAEVEPAAVSGVSAPAARTDTAAPPSASPAAARPLSPPAPAPVPAAKVADSNTGAAGRETTPAAAERALASSAQVEQLYRNSPAPGPDRAAADSAAPPTESVGKTASASPADDAGEGRSESPLDIASLAAQAERELQNQRANEHPAPFLATLSQKQRDAIPTLMYSQHDYTSAPGGSYVVINGSRVQPGQGVASGVQLVEILPDSIVLNAGGTQFRLKALNSWVNL